MALSVNSVNSQSHPSPFLSLFLSPPPMSSLFVHNGFAFANNDKKIVGEAKKMMLHEVSHKR
jgi:hypothetical protein